MSANVKTMFYVRQAPCYGLGTRVDDALSSPKALTAVVLNWNGVQKSIYADDKILIPSYKANVKESDGKILGVVTNIYKIVQNKEAFAFTDCLLGEGVRYETAGSLQNDKKVWMLAKLPERYKVIDNEVTPYMVFADSHDGAGSIKVVMTPVRVVCQNALNLALHNAKLDETMKTLLLAKHYMKKLNDERRNLSLKRITDRKVLKFIEYLIPISYNPSKLQENNIDLLRTDMKLRYFKASNLVDLPKTSWRFINAVSDFATHIIPLRKTENYKENLFTKTIDGNALIDKSYELVKSLV